jgi:hypothetical protein
MAKVSGGTQYPLEFGSVPIWLYAYMYPTVTNPDHFAGDYRELDTPEFVSDFYGRNFRYTDGGIAGGTITAFKDSFEGALIQRFDNVSVPVAQFAEWIFGFDTDAAYGAMLAGNDTILGTPLDDYVQGYGGNDVYRMAEGNDWVINGDPGNDLVDGGAGWDIVSAAGSRTGFMLPVWHGQVGLIPTNPAALAAEGVDKLLSVEAIAFADDFDQFTVGGDNFSPLDYVASYADLSNALGVNAQAGFDHYVYSGAFEGRAVTFSGWEYLASYGDLEQAFGLDPDAAASHYITAGRFEGRPVLFDGLEYIASQPDLIAAFGPDDDAGARHFLVSGRSEGRQITFDGLEYIAGYGDLIAAFGPNRDAGSTHFIANGFAEGRQDSFDGLQYIASYDDLIVAFGPNRDAGSTHFITNGHAEGRVGDDFDEVQYLANYADLQAAFGDDTEAATVHYIAVGHAEGRTDQPLTATTDFLL